MKYSLVRIPNIDSKAQWLKTEVVVVVVDVDVDVDVVDVRWSLVRLSVWASSMSCYVGWSGWLVGPFRRAC
jgi:hypothetical protein